MSCRALWMAEESIGTEGAKPGFMFDGEEMIGSICFGGGPVI